MSGAAGSKYGIINDGVPTTARDTVMQKLEPYMKSEEKVSTRYFECACHGLYHTLAITHFKASKAHTPDEMYICMLMDDRINFFKRLWKGLRFAFLRRPFYAEFAIEDSVQVSNIVNTLEKFR